MDFQALVDVYKQLETISSGNKIREILSEFFKTVPKEDIGIISYLTLGTIAAEYESSVLGMAEKSVLKAISMAGAKDSSKVRQIMKDLGDVGETAKRVLKAKPQTLIPLKPLTIHELFDTLHKIKDTSGTKSQEIKAQLLVSLLQRTSTCGAKFITRIVLGTLRLGVREMTVLDSLAIAYTGEKKNKEQLEQAYNICPDIRIVAETLANKGLKGLAKINIKVGRPIRMMLAQRLPELKDLEKKIPGVVIVDGKYDGERVQAHKDKKGNVSLYSRRLENVTFRYPDLVEYLKGGIKSKEFIVELESLAIDENGKHQHFQILMQRKRKTDIEEYVKKVPIQGKIFELLYLDGKNYMDQPLSKRIDKIKDITKVSKHLTVTDMIKTDSLTDIEDFFQSMLEQGYEGIMIKDPNGTYQAGTRGWNWIKWKKEYVDDMIDTFDLVIVGAFYGKGKRSGVYGAILCAVYNKEKDQYETLCKVGTGLTDQTLAELPKKLDQYKLKKKPSSLIIKKEMEPDEWFEPKVVIEVLAAEITKSQTHTAGLALRFPRFIKYRDDKKPEQTTSSKEIKEMYGN